MRAGEVLAEARSTRELGQHRSPQRRDRRRDEPARGGRQQLVGDGVIELAGGGEEGSHPEHLQVLVRVEPQVRLRRVQHLRREGGAPSHNDSARRGRDGSTAGRRQGDAGCKGGMP